MTRRSPSAPPLISIKRPRSSSLELPPACAQQPGCNLLVIGTRGMGASGNLVLGSVVTKVVHLTTIPVMLAY